MSQIRSFLAIDLDDDFKPKINKIMKTIRIRVQYINNQDIIARQLIDEIPEHICPELVEFRVLGSNIVEVTIKGYYTGIWHGKVEASSPMDLYSVERKIGRYIIIDDDTEDRHHINMMRVFVKSYCKVTHSCPARVLLNFAKNELLYKILGKTEVREKMVDEVVDLITVNDKVDWNNPITKKLLLLITPDRQKDMTRTIQ